MSFERMIVQGADGIAFVADSRPECEKDNRIALQAAERKATAMGFNALILSTFIEGEARRGRGSRPERG